MTEARRCRRRADRTGAGTLRLRRLVDPARRRGLRRPCDTPSFPRGARIRPRLCLAVAGACGDDDPASAEAAAAAIELLHCASLVHDDLPCFDDADPPRQGLGARRLRRAARRAGRRRADRARLRRRWARRWRDPGAPGDAAPHRRASGRLAASASSPARPGNAKSPSRSSDYQRAKTGALFVAATRGGRGGGRRGSGAVAHAWARSSARPIRSPTICATCSATRTNSASRSARTPCGRPNAAARTRRRRRGGASRRAGEGRGRLDPGLPRRRRAAHADQGADGAVLPQGARARRGLSRARAAPPHLWRRPATVLARALDHWRNSLLANPRFQRWAAASR